MRLPMWNRTRPNFGSSAHSIQPRTSSAPPDTKLASNASILAAPRLTETWQRPYRSAADIGSRAHRRAASLANAEAAKDKPVREVHLAIARHFYALAENEIGRLER